MSDAPRPHVWSGWPGPYCIYCFEESRQDLCRANHEQPCDREECKETACQAQNTEEKL